MRQAAMDGEKLAIPDIPELKPWLTLYIIAFVDLLSERYVEGGPIPWSKIEQYADAYGFDADQRWRCHLFTRKLEEVLHKHQEKQREKDKAVQERKRTAEALRAKRKRK